MFKGASDKLSMKDILLKPVAIIDPQTCSPPWAKEMEGNGIKACLWPKSKTEWYVVLVSEVLKKAVEVPLEDLVFPGISISPSTPVQEIFQILANASGRGGVVVDRDGIPQGVIDPGMLITLLWQRMHHVESFMNTLMDTVSEAVTVIDNENVVVGWNKRAEELYRIPAETILDQDIKHFFSSLVVTHVISEDVMKRKSVRNDYHQPVPGTHVLINASPILYQDQVLGSVCAERDITETVSLHNELSQKSSEVRQLKSEITKRKPSDDAFGKIFGHSKRLNDAVRLARRVANTNAAVLIRGESGTGKELFAEAIHQESARKGKPFVVINCGAIPAALFESELFGYQSGAFTGADRKGRPGKFEISHTGTIFLDEIGEMPLDLQVKLLRVLQNKRFYRVGGDEPIDVDVRVIAATHRDLEQMIEEQLFREDLYYRINVVSLEIPPLRQRKEDIPELIYLFIKEFCLQQNREMVQIAPEIMTTLLNYPWPGNIRELRNVVERMVILAEDNMILQDHLPPSISKKKSFQEKEPMQDDVSLTDITDRTEKEIILQALEESGGDKSKAAKRLGIPRSTMYYKMKKLDIKI
ncbi:sigma 54-interacting transcriptional regulator [Dehalobacterium formicoaceticum]|uniref:Sigma 54-interacting transcriptional regulator n=1 Tax=Dehalobacterium formicoaceticum TaxID=51515 RepID=A0ABT1Y4B4_9FIRM|nr:sigma 54-interacting transcriptional regulator [Dehalobacterium formicoaceticum]MCR6544511.1 sigma 54-interacting transcriptional regulator [Dehalobacterium formicoaceticum]